MLLCGAWLGSCVPGFAPPPAVALQQHGSWLERAHDNIRHEYLRLAALNGWAAQPDERERHLATVDAVREFSSRVKSQAKLVSELKSLNANRFKVDSAISAEQKELDAMTHNIAALTSFPAAGAPLAKPVAVQHKGSKATALAIKIPHIVDPEEALNKEHQAEIEAEAGREGGSVRGPGALRKRPWQTASPSASPLDDPFAPKFQAASPQALALQKQTQMDKKEDTKWAAESQKMLGKAAELERHASKLHASMQAMTSTSPSKTSHKSSERAGVKSPQDTLSGDVKTLGAAEYGRAGGEGAAWRQQMRVTPGDEEKAWQQAVRMEREREQQQEHAKERSTVQERARAERVDRLALEREVATRERQILTARQHESMQLDAMPPREARQLEQRQAPARWEGGGPQVLFRQQRLARPLQTWPTAAPGGFPEFKASASGAAREQELALQEPSHEQERPVGRLMQARVPVGVSQGQAFVVAIPGSATHMRVRVPAGLSSGDLVRFRAPVAPSQSRPPPLVGSHTSPTATQSSVTSDAMSRLQELKRLLTKSEDKERELDQLEMRSLSQSPPRLATPEERELAQEISRERVQAKDSARYLQHLHATPVAARARPDAHRAVLAESPREQEQDRFLAVLKRNAAPPPAAAHLAPVTRQYAVEPEEEEEQQAPSEASEEAPSEEAPSEEAPAEEAPAEPEPVPTEEAEPEVQGEAAPVEEAVPVAEEVEDNAGDAAGGSGESQSSGTMAWPPAASPSQPVGPGGEAEVAWPVGQPKGWGDRQDVQWHAASPPVVVAEQVPAGEDAGATQEEESGGAAEEAQSPSAEGEQGSAGSNAGAPGEAQPGTAEAGQEGAGTGDVNSYKWPAPGFVDPKEQTPNLAGELEWPGEKGQGAHNSEGEVPWPESVRGKTPPLPAKAPTGMQAHACRQTCTCAHDTLRTL